MYVSGHTEGSTCRQKKKLTALTTKPPRLCATNMMGASPQASLGITFRRVSATFSMSSKVLVNARSAS